MRAQMSELERKRMKLEESREKHRQREATKTRIGLQKAKRQDRGAANRLIFLQMRKESTEGYSDKMRARLAEQAKEAEKKRRSIGILRVRHRYDRK